MAVVRTAAGAQNSVVMLDMGASSEPGVRLPHNVEAASGTIAEAASTCK